MTRKPKNEEAIRLRRLSLELGDHGRRLRRLNLMLRFSLDTPPSSHEIALYGRGGATHLRLERIAKYREEIAATEAAYKLAFEAYALAMSDKVFPAKEA